MATYTGALTSSGLPELAEIGTVDFPAMTESRALHVTIRDPLSPHGIKIGGVSDEFPGTSVEMPSIVAQPDGKQLRMWPDGGTIDHVGDTLNLANSTPMTVAMVDGSGTQITSFGGGTQYTEADVDASITGTAVMWEDAADTLKAASAVNPFPVNVVAGSAGGPSKVDDSAFTIAVDSVAPIGALADEAATDSVNEGDVGLVRMTLDRQLYVHPGTGATDFGKVEGTPRVAADTGVLMLGVENSLLSPLVDIGDYCPIAVDQNGGLLLSNSATLITQDAADYAEDSAHGSANFGTFVLAVRNDSGATARTNANADYSPVSTDIRGRLWNVPSFETRSDTFTVPASGTTVTVATFPVKYFSMSVKGTTDIAAAWDVRVEASLDNVNFSEVLQHTNFDGDGVAKASNALMAFPALYFRTRCAGLTLGAATNVVVAVVGMN